MSSFVSRLQAGSTQTAESMLKDIIKNKDKDPRVAFVIKEIICKNVLETDEKAPGADGKIQFKDCDEDAATKKVYEGAYKFSHVFAKSNQLEGKRGAALPADFSLSTQIAAKPHTRLNKVQAGMSMKASK